MGTRILIADNDPSHRRDLEALVLRMGYRTILADGGLSAFGIISQHKDISLILLGLTINDMDGSTVLLKMRGMGITIPVIVLIHEEASIQIETAIKLGAIDFITKPVQTERAYISIANTLKLNALTQEVQRSRNCPHAMQFALPDIVMKSPEMEKAVIFARRAAALDAPVLITGEIGSGKETMARAICNNSEDPWRPFIKLDCRLLEVENADEMLFGRALADGRFYERVGGKLSEAHGGALFLEEVGRLSAHMQARLWTWMKTGSFTQDKHAVNVNSNARILASSSQPLEDLVHMGRFHPGLYRLLSAFTIPLPPLRKRVEDIPVLAHRFLLQFTSEERLTHISGIGSHAMERLKAYHWPGNIRELRQAIFRAAMLCEGDVLTVRNFPQLDSEAAKHERVGLLAVDETDERKVRISLQERNCIFSGIHVDGEVRTLAAAEEEMIRFAIAHYDGQISEAARRLGIGRTTLYRKLKEYGIDVAQVTGKNLEDKIDEVGVCNQNTG